MFQYYFHACSIRIFESLHTLHDFYIFVPAPIMLDTVNLSKEAGKVTDRDMQVIEKLWMNKDKEDLQRYVYPAEFIQFKNNCPPLLYQILNFQL